MRVCYFCTEPGEARDLREATRAVAALHDAEYAEAAAQEALPEADLFYLDITRPDGLDLARNTRVRCPDAAIVIIAAADISPVSYLTPKILPTALLLRPLRAERARETIAQLFQELFQKEEFFSVHAKEGHVRLRFFDIDFFEAYDKRILLHSNSRVYSFYSTLGKLSGELPEGFLRCHKSFIVNTKKIARMRFAEGYVELQEDLRVPISRSYKQKLREYML